MKLLLDACVWGGARKGLRAAGHDVIGNGGRTSVYNLTTSFFD